MSNLNQRMVHHPGSYDLYSERSNGYGRGLSSSYIDSGKGNYNYKAYNMNSRDNYYKENEDMGSGYSRYRSPHRPSNETELGYGYQNDGSNPNLYYYR